MSFTDRLVLWLHIGFAIFTVGPVALAISSTPRYIRRRDVPVLRYLTRITLIFTIGSLLVLVFGIVLGQLDHDFAHPWLTAAMTLFVVAIVLLVLIIRDQRRAIKALAPDATTSDGQRRRAVGVSTDRRRSGARRPQLGRRPARQARQAPRPGSRRCSRQRRRDGPALASGLRWPRHRLRGARPDRCHGRRCKPDLAGNTCPDGVAAIGPRARIRADCRMQTAPCAPGPCVTKILMLFVVISTQSTAAGSSTVPVVIIAG